MKLFKMSLLIYLYWLVNKKHHFLCIYDDTYKNVNDCEKSFVYFFLSFEGSSYVFNNMENIFCIICYI